MKLNQFYVDDLIKRALLEDINYVDVASDNIPALEKTTEAVMISKAEGVLAGIDVAMRVFEMLDDSIKVKTFFKDGDKILVGDKIAEIKGSGATLLKGERTALNLLQHMSGVASATAKFVDLVKGTNAKITDTRKTLPGLRAIEKYAVTCGGGANHRFNLSDGAMLKDNHIDAGGGITSAVRQLREKLGHMVKIEVETRTLDEVKEAVESGCEIIMLDNMDCDTMKKAVELNQGRALLEASGNVNLDTVRAIAETGVDIISIGALTHSVMAFDISMRIK